MKIRLLIIGCVISALGAILLIKRGVSAGLTGLLAAGVLLFVVGLLWK